MSQYEYPGRVAATNEPIVDGDTVDLRVDLGFRTTRLLESARLRRVDTHEIHFVDDDSEEYRLGMEEKRVVRDWFERAGQKYDGDWPLIVTTHEGNAQGAYGRWLVDVRRKFDGEDLAEYLLGKFEGVAYDG